MNIFKETETIELKESTSQTNRAIESIVAMLNKSGHAIVYFGIDNKGNPTKQTFSDKTILKLSQEITNNIFPHIIPTIQFVSVGEFAIIKVEAFGNDQPYTAYDKFYIRSGTQNKKLLANEVKSLALAYMPNVIGEMESYNQELNFSILKGMYRDKGIKFKDNNFYANNGLLTKNGKFNLLAELVSDVNSFSIKVVRFAGKDKTKMLFRKEFGYKSLLNSLNDVINYVEALNETKVKLSGKAQREEIYLFDKDCFKEAWLNACLHNRWCGYIPPAVYIFDDRLEIISYGGIPMNLSQEDFYNGVSSPVNKQLQFIMGKLNMVEQTGHGVPEIVSKYGTQAFKLTDNYVIVTLKFKFNLESDDFKDITLKFKNKTVKQVYDLILNNNEITKQEISKKINVGTTCVSNILKQLKDEGFIERIGSNKSGYWKVNK